MKKTLLLFVFALMATTLWGQKPSCIIRGHASAVPDSTQIIALINNASVARDTIIGGRFVLTVPTDSLQECDLLLQGEGMPSFYLSLFIAPGVETEVTGDDLHILTWRATNPLPEQTTKNRIMDCTREPLDELQRLAEAGEPWKQQRIPYIESLRRTIDLLPQLPADRASVTELMDMAHAARAVGADFPYLQELRDAAEQFARRCRGFEQEMARVRHNLYPPAVQDVGDKAPDADLYDAEGRIHHIADVQGRYVLLDFWSLGCGPCRMAEPEMREVYEQHRDRMEIVGINVDNYDNWRTNEWAAKLTWPNWNDRDGQDGLMARLDGTFALPTYVLLSPEGRILRKMTGYGPGMFRALAHSLDGPAQDNSRCRTLVVSQVQCTRDSTVLAMRYYGQSDYWFRIASSSYLRTADGHRYPLISARDIALDAETFPGACGYKDFTLVFQPFADSPVTFDFIEGDADDAFRILSIEP